MSWALRLIGRRSLGLNTAAVAVAERLASSPPTAKAARWVGKGALKELTSPAVARQLAARSRTRPRKESTA